MRLSNKAFKLKLSKRRPLRKVNMVVIGNKMYDLYSDGSVRNGRVMK